MRLSMRMGEREALSGLGAVLDRHTAESKKMAEEYAAKWTAEKRREAVKNGDAMPDGSFPIVDQEDMNNAAGLIGNSSHSKSEVAAHMKKQAKKHGLTLPKSLQSN